MFYRRCSQTPTGTVFRPPAGTLRQSPTGTVFQSLADNTRQSPACTVCQSPTGTVRNCHGDAPLLSVSYILLNLTSLIHSH